MRAAALTILLGLSPLTGMAAQEGRSEAPVEIDHVFVFVEPGAPEIEALRDAGFIVPPQVSRHVGQGTASRSVMFRNAYLELIWIDDATEFANVGFGMPERRAAPDGSPFGTGLRFTGPDDSPPFPTEPYTAPWMTGSGPILVAEWSGELVDPFVFVVPEWLRWDRLFEQVPEMEAMTRHAVGMTQLTSVRMAGPGLPTGSPVVAALSGLGVVEFQDAETHVLHLTFDEGDQGQTLDLRPTLPIVLHY